MIARCLQMMYGQNLSLQVFFSGIIVSVLLFNLLKSFPALGFFVLFSLFCFVFKSVFDFCLLFSTSLYSPSLSPVLIGVFRDYLTVKMVLFAQTTTAFVYQWTVCSITGAHTSTFLSLLKCLRVVFCAQSFPWKRKLLASDNLRNQKL